MKQKYNRRWLIPVGIILVITTIILILLFLLRGTTVIQGEYPDNEKSESLTCIVENTTYSFMKDDGEGIKIKINTIFTKNVISSISLTATKTYSDELSANQALARMMANMNRSFDTELGAGAFNATYSTNEAVAQMNLYANADALKAEYLKYFMIDDLPQTIEQYQSNYESQGFKCKNN